MSTTITDDIVDVRIDGDVTGQIAIGHHIVQVMADRGAIVNVAPPEEQIVPRRRPGPAHRLPRPFLGLIGREPETDAALIALASGDPVEFSAEAGWGKSALLRSLAHQPRTGAPDGVIYSRVQDQPIDDLLQLVFESLYETDGPFKPTPAQLQEYLQDPEPLVVLDDLDAPREDVQMLLDAAPRARFLLASAERNLWGEGSALALRGLDDGAGVALFEQELGRALAAHEVEDARALCRALDGHPLRILQAAALVRTERRSMADALAMLSSAAPAAAMTAATMDALDAPERLVAGMLAGLGGTSLRADLVARVSGIAGAETVLDSLLRRGLAKEDEGRYRSAGPFAVTASQGEQDSSTWRRKVIAVLPAWLEEHRDDPQGVLAETELLNAALGWAANADDWDAVVDLGRRVAPSLLLGARWGSWARVIRKVIEAARIAEDRAAEAWSLNELGLHRALWDQDLDASVAIISEAVELWTSIGDDTGADMARHNCAVLLQVPPPPPPPEDSWPPTPPNPWRRVVAGLLTATVALVGGLVAWKLIHPDTPAVALQVEGGGAVSSLPSGIDCPGDCSEQFGSGTSVVFTAVADEGWVLAGWTEACAGTPIAQPCVLDVSGDASAGARFELISPPVGSTVTVEVQGDGRITSDPSAIFCPTDCFGEFPVDTTVTLTADPVDGWTLSRWGGTCEGTPATDPCFIQAKGDGSVTAAFERTVGTVRPIVTVWVVGEGSVTSTPSGIDCRSHCTVDVRAGSDLALTANPDAGWELSGWTGSCSGTPVTDPCSLHLAADESITATFQRITTPGTPTVGVEIRGNGAVTSTPSGIDCREACATTFPTGTTVTLTARPDEGWELAAWGGTCAETSVTEACRFDLTNDAAVSVTFSAIMWDVQVAVDGQGTVTSDPSGITCRQACSADFPTGTTVTLTADPDDVWELSGWGGACAGRPLTTPCSFELTKTVSVSATFELPMWDLRVSVEGQGTVASDPPGMSCRDDCTVAFPTGTKVALTATPDAGWYLLSWGGACDGTPTNQRCVLDLTGSLTVTVHFSPNIE